MAPAAVLADRGSYAAGVDRIAAKARVIKAMIYYHSDSKLGLYVEVLRDMFRAVGARARAIADGPGTPEEKIDAWVTTIVDEASQRPWFPPIMLRELASGAPHLDSDTLAMMNVVYGAVRDIIVQGQKQGVFREADPLFTHLTILPAVLLYFVRERAIARRPDPRVLIAGPRPQEEFLRHIREIARRILLKDPR